MVNPIVVFVNNLLIFFIKSGMIGSSGGRNSETAGTVDGLVGDGFVLCDTV